MSGLKFEIKIKRSKYKFRKIKLFQFEKINHFDIVLILKFDLKLQFAGLVDHLKQ
ncbi:hypothetical protein BpHYR1_035706 [Brachionus plicatilis]|uniref:Uncharacterized protein n=1 Tax=Brachionus plicatilis TaxID=10195 RepID=A0A3M7PCH2_BRAPC|nr:hypothetical protein BpHYR1_035706 [Brachionus plicatilis]